MKHIVTILTAVGLLASVVTVTADHHETDLIKGKVGQFYNQMRAGNFEEAFGNISAGSRGFLANGMLGEIPNEQVLSAVIASYKQISADGGEINLIPKHLTVSFHGTVALVTYYVDGDVKTPEEDRRNVLERATQVWEKKGDDWKLIHWHNSKLQADQDE